MAVALAIFVWCWPISDCRADLAGEKEIFVDTWSDFEVRDPPKNKPWFGVSPHFRGVLRILEDGSVEGTVRATFGSLEAERTYVPEPLHGYTRAYECNVANPIHHRPEGPLWRVVSDSELKQGLSAREYPVTGTVEGNNIHLTFPDSVDIKCDVYPDRIPTSKPKLGSVVKQFPLPEILRNFDGRVAERPIALYDKMRSVRRYEVQQSSTFGNEFSGAACNVYLYEPDLILSSPPGIVNSASCYRIARFYAALTGEDVDLTARADRKIVLPTMPALHASGGGKRDAKGLVSLGSEAGFNTIRVMIPDNASNRKAIEEGRLSLRANIVSTGSKGRLFSYKHSPAESVGGQWSTGSTEVVWRSDDIKLGEELVFYYRWVGDPPKKRFAESVKLTAAKLGKTAEKTVGFDVGMDLQIKNITLPEPIQTQRSEPLTIQVKDAFSKDGSDKPAARLQELGLMPVLRVRRCGFNPTISGQLYNALGPGLLRIVTFFVPEARQYSYDATDTAHQSSRVEADLWALPVEDNGTLQIRAKGPLVVPSIRFNGLGDHAFEVDIVGLVSGKEASPLSDVREIEFPDPHPGTFGKAAGCPDTEWYWNWSVKELFDSGYVKPAIEFVNNTLKLSVNEIPAKDRIAKSMLVCIKAFTKSPLALANCIYRVLFTVPGAVYDLLTQDRALRLSAVGSALQNVLAVEDQSEPRATAVETSTLKPFAELLRSLKDVRLVLVARDPEGDIVAASSSDGRLEQAGADAGVPALLTDIGKKVRAPADRTSPKRLFDSKRYTIIPLGRDETLKLDLRGAGKPGEVIVLTQDRITRAAFPKEGWQASLEIEPDGALKHLSGAKLAAHSEEITETEFPDASVEPAPPAPPTPLAPPAPTPNAEPAKPEVGGQCNYSSHPGTCTVTQVSKTAASAAQAKVEGGAGYEGREVKFAFTSRAPIASEAGRKAMREQHELRLKNSWYPGPRFLDKYGVAPGKSFACTLRIRTKGACTPTVFDFPKIDTGDTSQAR